MSVQSAAGATLRISAAMPATFDGAGYALIFPAVPVAANPRVGEITDLGEFGREFALITHNPIGTRATQKFKGSFNEGTMSLTLAMNTADAGQVLMRAASLSDAAHSFEVRLQNGARYYFLAQVMSWKIGVGSVDQLVSATVQLEITSSAAGVGVVEVLV